MISDANQQKLVTIAPRGDQPEKGGFWLLDERGNNSKKLTGL